MDSNEIQFENYQFFINHQIIEQYPLLKPFVYQLLNNDDSTYKEKLIQKLIMCNFKNSFNIEDCYFKVRFILFYECEIDCPKIPLLSTFLRDELDLYYYVKKYKFSLNTYGPFFYLYPYDAFATYSRNFSFTYGQVESLKELIREKIISLEFINIERR